MVDYLIVGCGLAGMAFAETALQNGNSIKVFDDNSQNSSLVAAGLYNPVILKRFSGLQNSQQQLDILQEFYSDLEQKLGITINYKIPVLRKFASVEEQNDWFIAADKQSLADYLSTTLRRETIEGVLAPFGFGEVMQTGYVDTVPLLIAYRDYLIRQDLFVDESFRYEDLEITDEGVNYKNHSARNIIFAEGFGLAKNPFFNYLPLDGTKGELLTIKAPKLLLNEALNGSIFILPIGGNLFKVGATYNWSDKTEVPTEEGKNELLEKLKDVINCEFEVVGHYAGVRPTVRDRKPLLGKHPKHGNMHILNGLGTRGVMLGPYMAQELIRFIEGKGIISAENDISRFLRFYPKPYCN